MNVDRRDLLKAGVFAGAAIGLPVVRSVGAAAPPKLPLSKLPKPFTMPFKRLPDAVPSHRSATTDYYEIEETAKQAEIIPGYRSWVYSYAGSVPGPTIHAQRDRQTVVRFRNLLPEFHPTLGYESWTSVHLHGGNSLPQYDGYAGDITRPGEYKDYSYLNNETGRTIWYHDHGEHHTAENAYHGLAGMYVIHDPAEEAQFPLPTGAHDVCMVVHEAAFAADGNLWFSLANENMFPSDVILVNGVPWPVLKVKRRKYRFRIVVGAMSRAFGFSLSNGMPLKVIASDGGLLPRAVDTKVLRQCPGERYEIVIDFAEVFKGAPVGARVNLMNSPTVTVNVDGPNTNKVMAFELDSDPDTFDPTNNGAVPAELRPIDAEHDWNESQVVTDREWLLHRQNGLWKINRTTWEDIVLSGYELVGATMNVGDVERWTWRNSAGGWYHPSHAHFIDSRIISRNGKPPLPYETGLKDTLFLGQTEEIKVLVRADSPGTWMIHCHNIIHEDHDMMTQFRVVGPGGEGGDDPLRAAPPRDIAAEALDRLF
ncbi:MAG: multicopper oxidase family protein [Acidobacteria bacterium]|nr:multicopper oxidase family protein [Acidobacteriota bacterium]